MSNTKCEVRVEERVFVTSIFNDFRNKSFFGI